MLKLYPQLARPSCDNVQESQAPYLALTERHLQIVWLEQKLLKNLLTSQGERIEVISPGIWNMEAGPDFLHAHLRIGEREYRGDIEIHLFEAGWYQHGHHSDANYNQVILHISYGRPSQPRSIYKENGQSVDACYLNESLAVSADELITLIDFDFYPGKIFPTQGRCANQVFQRLPETQIKQLFQSAAYWRLEKKLNYLQLICPSRPLQFASGIAMALGYKHNAKAFLELFLYLMNYRDSPYQELLAIALGCCGFLEEGRKESWESSIDYQHLRSLWWGKKDQMTHQAHLKLDHIRPLHHPVRRLAYLAHLLQDPNLEQLWFLTLQIWEKAINDSSLSFKKLKERLLSVFPAYHNDYWESHYTFEAHVQKKKLPFLGNDLKMHILLNTLLPLLYAEVKDSTHIQKWEKFQQFYLSLETTSTSKSRYLHQRFFGNEKNEQFFNQAQIVQGAYQLHQDFCLHYEASCQGCPFVERYQAHRSMLAL